MAEIEMSDRHNVPRLGQENDVRYFAINGGPEAPVYPIFSCSRVLAVRVAMS